MDGAGYPHVVDERALTGCGIIRLVKKINRLWGVGMKIMSEDDRLLFRGMARNHRIAGTVHAIGYVAWCVTASAALIGISHG
jgi:hypothetical protein